MDIFDLIGPIMVGPSSSHTAGAVRIGLACRRILGEEVAEADITLSGSFAATGRGHGRTALPMRRKKACSSPLPSGISRWRTPTPRALSSRA